VCCLAFNGPLPLSVLRNTAAIRECSCHCHSVEQFLYCTRHCARLHSSAVCRSRRRRLGRSTSSNSKLHSNSLYASPKRLYYQQNLLQSSTLLCAIILSELEDYTETTCNVKGHEQIHSFTSTPLHTTGEVQAEKKKCTVADVTAKIVAAKPVSNSTKAEACKFHDDKSLYTGAHDCHEAMIHRHSLIHQLMSSRQINSKHALFALNACVP
jgi:hypothetical protein